MMQQETYYHKIISTDLSRQTNETFFLQINFAGNLEEHNGTRIFFIVEKQQKLLLF